MKKTDFSHKAISPVIDAHSAEPVELQTLVFNTSPNKIAVFDNASGLHLANTNLASFLGKSCEELIGKRPSELFHGKNIEKLETAIDLAAENGEPQIVELELTDLSGQSTQHIFKIFAVGEKGNGDRQVIVYGHDIDDLVKLKAAVAMTQDQLQTAVLTMPDMFWIKDIDGHYLHCNNAFDEFNHVASGRMIGKTMKNATGSSDLKIHAETDTRALNSKEPVTFEVAVDRQTDEGTEKRVFTVQKMAIRNHDGEATGIVGLARDITENRKLEEEIRQRERLYKGMLDNIPDCIMRHAVDGRVLYYNAAMADVLKKQLGGVTSTSQIEQNNKARETALKTVFRAVKRKRAAKREVSFQVTGGDVLTHEIRYFPEFNSAGEMVSVLGVGRDITDRRLAERELRAKEEELRRLAYTDNLTGLANRVRMHETVKSYLEDAIAKNDRMAVLTLDIDRFKSINDTLGHLTGDNLLVEFAKRLKNVVGKRGWLGRLGGDEFVVILPSIKSRDAAEAFANEIITAINHPMCLGGSPVSISTSVGIAIGPEDSTCETTLFRFSDIALYHAKAAGRNRACSYSPSMSEEAESLFRLEAMINEGLNEGQFDTYFQAKVNLSTRQISGAEALCRWHHPEHGFIRPDNFIPLAEETGQIVEIGKLVLRKACEFAVACNEISETPFTVAVNVSARQFVFGGFLSALGQCLEETGCKAEWLELEITESMLLKGSGVICDMLEAIAKLGIMISIDDFGTGYSALSYLRNLPIGGLKVDQSFVRDMQTDEKQQVLVRTVLAMAEGLKLSTVAEGIECEDVARRLEALGCQTGQGYLWHRPSPGEELLERLKAQRATAKRKTSYAL